jgi:uncharacterized membrane protein
MAWTFRPTTSALRLLLPLLAIGTAARVRYYAAHTSYWYDEAYLLLNVFRRSWLELLGPLHDDQAAPPLFLWCLRGLYRTVGGGEWAMRLPALAAGLLALMVLVPLARRAVGRRGWLWAVACGALCPHAIAHACEVKPYTLDVLVAEVVLLAALGCLRASARGGTRERLFLGIMVVLSPWLSFPAVFVAGSACLALLADALRRRRRGLLLSWLVVQGAFLLSCLALWLAVIRHQSTGRLHRFWDSSFLDLSSPQATLTWLARCLVEAGNYAGRDVGLVVVVLAVLGGVSLWRRAPARLLLLAGPLVLALAACALRYYPLAGRLLLFLAPSLWLLGARGLVCLARLLPQRKRWLGPVLPVVLLVPAGVWVGRNLAEVTPRAQFREAFQYVHENQGEGDGVWVSHPQVYEVYHGRPPELSAYSTSEEVVRAARRGRLWLIASVGARGITASELIDGIRSGPFVVLQRRRFKGLEVVLFAPEERARKQSFQIPSGNARLPVPPTAPARDMGKQRLSRY